MSGTWAEGTVLDWARGGLRVLRVADQVGARGTLLLRSRGAPGAIRLPVQQIRGSARGDSSYRFDMPLDPLAASSLSVDEGSLA